MKTVVMLMVVAVVAIGLAGCYSTPIMPPSGWIYSSIKAPLDPNLSQTTLGPKMGSAETQSVFGMVATGDCSIKTAARNGGIQTVTYADYEYFNMLGVFQRFIVTVYGQ